MTSTPTDTYRLAGQAQAPPPSSSQISYRHVGTLDPVSELTHFYDNDEELLLAAAADHAQQHHQQQQL